MATICGTNSGETIDAITLGYEYEENTIYGLGGGDYLNGGRLKDIIYANDPAPTSAGEQVHGREGNVIIYGGNGSDHFVYQVADLGAANTIGNFTSGSDTGISVDRDGAGSAYSSENIAIFQGVTGLNLNDMISDGNVIIG